MWNKVIPKVFLFNLKSAQPDSAPQQWTFSERQNALQAPVSIRVVSMDHNRLSKSEKMPRRRSKNRTTQRIWTVLIARHYSSTGSSLLFIFFGFETFHFRWTLINGWISKWLWSVLFMLLFTTAILLFTNTNERAVADATSWHDYRIHYFQTESWRLSHQ